MKDDMKTWDQVKRFHAMVRDLSQQVPFLGQMRDEEYWKRLVIGAACGQEIVPNPFGDGMVVMNKQRVRSMTVPTMSELIEQMFAYGAENGVEWSDPEFQSLIESEKDTA